MHACMLAAKACQVPQPGSHVTLVMIEHSMSLQHGANGDGYAVLVARCIRWWTYCKWGSRCRALGRYVSLQKNVTVPGMLEMQCEKLKATDHEACSASMIARQ